MARHPGSDTRPPTPRHVPSITTKPKSRALTLCALFVLLALVGIATRIMTLPLNLVIERRYCQDYYAEHDPSQIPVGGWIPEEKCKGDEVQQRLGRLQGILETGVFLCDIAVTAPMGYLADRLGTRFALAMNISATAVFWVWIVAVGYFRNIFDTEAMLFGPFIVLFGGGSCVLKAVSLALVAEMAECETRRASIIAYMSSVEYVASLLGPFFAALLLTPGEIWLPFWVGLGFLAISLPLTLFLPGRREKQKLDHDADSADAMQGLPLLRDDRPSTAPPAKRGRSTTTDIVTFFSGYAALITGHRNFQLLLAAFALSGFSSSTSGLLLRYISKRYKLPFVLAGYLFTLKSGVNVFMFLVFVPAFAKLMAKRARFSPAYVDLLGSSITLWLSAFGALLIAASPGFAMVVVALLIYATGSILPVYMYSLTRSSAVSHSDVESEGRAFALVVLSNSAGHLVGVPLVTAIWVRAIEVGGGGLGFPFYVSAVGYVATAVVMSRLRLA